MSVLKTNQKSPFVLGYIKKIKTLCAQNVGLLNVKLDGTHSNHYTLTG
jgi:hypothetical protein